MKVIKKDGTLQDFNKSKIIDAAKKSADRVLVEFSDDDYDDIVNEVIRKVKDNLDEDGNISVATMHNIVEVTLDEVNPNVATSYRGFRNYKTTHLELVNNVYKEVRRIMYIGDKENSNTDSALVATKRSLIHNELAKELYKRFFLNVSELEAIRQGYIYIHDMSSRDYTMNCCLFDMANVLSDGFEMGNLWYNEPKSLSVAFDVIGDVTLSAASQQYGGFTIPEVDSILYKYAKLSLEKYKSEYLNTLIDAFGAIKLTDEIERKVEDYAYNKVAIDLHDGFQGWEYKFNTVGSSRGDYPFTTLSFGLEIHDRLGRLINKCILETRMKGQGMKGFKRPVLFPKLTFLYDEELHGEGKIAEDIFDLAIECSSKCMYPDFVSLSGEGYIPSIYKKYGKPISLMGQLLVA